MVKLVKIASNTGTVNKRFKTDFYQFFSKTDFLGQKRGCGGLDWHSSNHFQIFYSVIVYKIMQYLTSASPHVNFDPISPPLISMTVCLSSGKDLVDLHLALW